MNTPLYIVNIEAAIFKHDKWLLGQRSTREEHAAGSLALIGGKVESAGNEDRILEETLRREIMEEVGVTVHDTMHYVKSDVATICIGQAASAAAVLLASGAKGKRFSLPNARVLIHQVMGGAEGQAKDVAIQTQEMLRIKQQVDKILSKHTGQPVAKIEKDTDRDFFMIAEDAKKYGIIDKIITS